MTIKRPVTVREYVYEQLKSNILSGVYRPGQRLIEATLAEELEVSRTPIRDALNRLEIDGLITTSPHKGIFVTKITKRDVQDFYQTRAVLEGLSAKLAAEVAEEKELEEFKLLLTEMEHIFERDREQINYKEIAQSNVKFHQKICKMSKNDVLFRMLGSLDSAITLIRSTSWTNYNRKFQTYLEHQEIAKAILERNGELAQRKAEEHIFSAWKSAEIALQKQEEEE
ncbi:GntR family transcriptional regulator [Ammoniphilus resinae]|uniref:DNA-binding GntR family transcriptional regulator n=1 Tax=Ammoniphilus resinae TaxID=861532 RepID=A0ABS4GUG0_9BACL|nr:GntR family transcriptional regulator [Ammoniphilus resinae]MBP1933893.1 DNA-binding GntR family transcriptional regulator [Ammoniphilus resinae]